MAVLSQDLGQRACKGGLEGLEAFSLLNIWKISVRRRKNKAVLTYSTVYCRGIASTKGTIYYSSLKIQSSYDYFLDRKSHQAFCCELPAPYIPPSVSL